MKSDELNQTTNMSRRGQLSPRFSKDTAETPQNKTLARKVTDTELVAAKSAFKKKPPEKQETSLGNQSTLAATIKDKAIAKEWHKREGTPEDKVQRPAKREVNSENPLAPRRITIREVQKHVLPEQFVNANDFELI